MIKVGTTSYKQTKYGILPRHKTLKLEAQGTKKGLVFLNQSINRGKKISPDFIKQIHKMCYFEILMENAGKFRIVQVTYSGKEAPHFSKIHEMIRILCEDIEYALNHLPKSNNQTYINRVIEILANFQHRFVFIHPFIDYNGRTARIFTSYILMRLNLPIIEIKTDKRKERQEYIAALQNADKGDYQDLEKIINKALNESLIGVFKK